MEMGDQQYGGGKVGTDNGNQPSSLEEMRKRRLAYFNAAESGKSIGPSRRKEDIAPSEQASLQGYKHNSGIRNSTLDFENFDNSKKDSRKTVLSDYNVITSSGNPQQSLSQNSYDFQSNVKGKTKVSEQHQENTSCDSMYISKPESPMKTYQYLDSSLPSKDPHILSDEFNQLDIRKSDELYKASILKDQVDCGDLGLSTHRPESCTESSARNIPKEFFNLEKEVKKTQELFSDKSAEEMRMALGDQAFEDLMIKVNRDVGDLHRGKALTRTQNEFGNDEQIVTEGQNKGELLSKIHPAEDSDPKLTTFREQSPRRRINRPKHQSPHKAHMISKNLNQLKEGEKEVLSLVRNYDQVTMPKNTRNSFSADEIYRQAFGDQSDVPLSGDRYHYGNHFHTSGSHPWAERNFNSVNHQEDRHNHPPVTPFKKSFYESNACVSPNYSYHHGYPFSYPPPPYDTHPYTGISQSPQSPGSPYMQNVDREFPFHTHPHRGVVNGQHSPQIYPDPRATLSSTANEHHMTIAYNQQHVTSTSVPSGSTVGPPLPSSSYYPPPLLAHPPVLKFPANGVPLHLPPPPIPSHPSQATVHTQHSVPSARRNSWTHHGPPAFQGSDPSSPGFMKMPHPPATPPALKATDEQGSKSKHRSEIRRMTSPAMPPHIQSCGEEVNGFNLQRYFSSLDLYEKEASEFSLSAQPNTSRSVEGDFYKCESEAASAFTNVSGVTSASKVGGITSRLMDLGVDLDHLRHLRVVDKKMDQEATDSHFETLSKGVRYCPECSSTNKVYMDWCTECGEVLIGVEPTIPKSKKKQMEEKEKKRKGVSSKSTRGRESQRVSESTDNLYIDVHTAGSEGGYRPKDSPESGRGLSLSNSPVRYWREHEETGEPKDSGRASSGDIKERALNFTRDEGVTEKDESENDDNDVDDDDDDDDRERGSTEGPGDEAVEYIYEDSQPDFFEEISDPVLKEFLISYRNKQISNRDKQQGERKKHVASAFVNVPSTASTPDCPRKKSKDDVKSRENIHHGEKDEERSKTATDSVQPLVLAAENTRSNNLQYKKMYKTDLHCHEGVTQKTTSDKGADSIFECKSNTDNSLPTSEKNVQKKTGKRKKKKKFVMMDIEIFGYEESRISRDSYRGANIVPILDLKRSSDEEEESEEDNDDDDDDEIENKLEQSNDESDHSDENSKTNGIKQSSTSSSVSAINPYQSVRQSGSPQTQENSSVLRSQPLRTNARSSVPPPVQNSQGQSEAPHFSRRTRRGTAGSPGYQRHWAKSSIAWSSYNPRELNTRSSLDTSTRSPDIRSKSRPMSARTSHSTGYVAPDNNGAATSTNVRGSSGIPVRQRPASAEYSHRKPVFSSERKQRPSSASVRSSSNMPESHSSPELTQANVKSGSSSSAVGPGAQRVSSAAGRRSSPQAGPRVSHTSIVRPEAGNSDNENKDTDSPRCSELHRLPQEQIEDKVQAAAMNAYCKFQEMTPRIVDGELSRWQCLPDEIWLYIFNFLSQGDLTRLMVTCQYFYRLANDESLWKYITVRQRYAMTDESLAAIAQHQPVSLAMVKCQGTNVSVDGLHHFFKETQHKLKELNVCGCSQGSLVGAIILQVASQYCCKLSHLDASFCNLNNEAVMAISECADRFESVCLNGFQSISDSALLTLMKKHGKSLRTLELYACFSLNASVLRSLGEHCTSLKRLCLGSCNKLTDSTMITLSTHLSRIEQLDLRGCKNLRNDCIRKIVRNCPRIHTLVLANCQQISDVALTEIATYLKSTLRVLDVCGCDQVSDQGAISLAKNCDRLNSLDISSTRCTSVSINQLATNNCSRWLETLKLSFLSAISEACMQNLIKHCRRLKLIHVFGCSSLRNLTRLRALNSNLCLEGDSDAPRHFIS